MTTTAIAPIVRRAMLRLDILDQPNHRSSHSKPVPRGGGLACLAGAVSGCVAAGGSRPAARATVPILALAVVGLVDDRSGGVAPSTRLLAQVIAGAAVGLGRSPGRKLFSLVAVPIAVNVFNFMDGINGISSATAALWGLQAMRLASHDGQASELGVLGALAAGAGVGFFPWNAPNARLFLGDVGSYHFGAIIACGLVAASRKPQLCAACAAPLTPYVVDAAQAMARRALRGERLTEAHREHAYQYLVDRGSLSHMQATVIHATLAAIVTLCWDGGTHRRIAIAVLLGAYAAVPYAFNVVTPRETPRGNSTSIRRINTRRWPRTKLRMPRS